MVENRWFSVNTHNANNNCFTKDDVQNFGFKEWKDEWEEKEKRTREVEKRECKKGKKISQEDKNLLEKSASCQSCSQQEGGCSGLQCPTLSRNRSYYNLGPLKRGCSAGGITEHLYTFPLALNYGYWPDINIKLNTWAKVP